MQCGSKSQVDRPYTQGKVFNNYLKTSNFPTNFSSVNFILAGDYSLSHDYQFSRSPERGVHGYGNLHAGKECWALSDSRGITYYSANIVSILGAEFAICGKHTEIFVILRICEAIPCVISFDLLFSIF